SLACAGRGARARRRGRTRGGAPPYRSRGDERICVVSLGSPHSLRTIVPVGAALPMDRGSAGRVLRDEPGARQRGWAESVEERERGVASVSAPVRSPAALGGRVVAGGSVSGQVERTTRAPGRGYARGRVA